MPVTTKQPARKKAPEPPGASTKRSDKLRKEREAMGLAEVRGCWAPTEHHETIKEFARSITARKSSD